MVSWQADSPRKWEFFFSNRPAEYRATQWRHEGRRARVTRRDRLEDLFVLALIERPVRLFASVPLRRSSFSSLLLLLPSTPQLPCYRPCRAARDASQRCQRVEAGFSNGHARVFDC